MKSEQEQPSNPFSSSYFSEEDSGFLYESAKQIVMKQMTSIGWKIRYVVLMLPRHKEQSMNYLKKWDLWGPMIICLLFALPMALVNENPDYEEDFINVFLIFWIGAAFISVNCKLLGSKGSLFLSISTLGYCLVPLTIVGFFTTIFHSVLPSLIKLIIIALALCWSSISCMMIMGSIVSEDRKWLCGYPIFLFYTFLAWFAIIA